MILRTSWLYSLRRDSFVTKVLSWGRRQTSLRVVADQVGNPTWSRPLAETISQLLAMSGRDPYSWILERKGIYHLAGDGYASRYEWAQTILALDLLRSEQIVEELQSGLTSDFTTPAPRPLYSVLNCDRFTNTFGLKLPAWQDPLRLAMES